MIAAAEKLAALACRSIGPGLEERVRGIMCDACKECR